MPFSTNVTEEAIIPTQRQGDTRKAESKNAVQQDTTPRHE